MPNVIIEDLISLFLRQKIDKNTLIKILEIYKISHKEFNKEVIEKIRESTNRPILKISTFLDDSYLKKLKNMEFPKSTTLCHKRYDFDELYKSNKFITYKSISRMLSVDEIASKVDQYYKIMNINCRPDKDTIEYFHKSIEAYIKKLIEKCDKLDTKTIKKMLGKDKHILNIYDI
ncbi:hypothetical protein NCER_101283 [Vairimorpha ceranae BRL01]|uniref:Uncharacterized protein n=2 Tax=Vairimorpha ceranae TaxID=40302 RepID=C4V9M7_VAIC1|nr:hypothetical protein AAJ76_2700033485 [Vairimorpha ceranae]EEQ82072.1 hypothetical protein NCER_101283 [Vairimorpha ceranae BRL01]KAF5140525.1 hypothetical protein G9O61_00g013300 [Vairimorpha ceranae]KKO75246.1 hypothetical protein AAJ76_2700033485 [Vairimorpha ceranae]